MKLPIKKKKIIFDGFEALHDFDKKMMWAIEDFMEENDISSEFDGAIVIEIDYTFSTFP